MYYVFCVNKDILCEIRVAMRTWKLQKAKHMFCSHKKWIKGRAMRIFHLMLMVEVGLMLDGAARICYIKRELILQVNPQPSALISLLQMCILEMNSFRWHDFLFSLHPRPVFYPTTSMHSKQQISLTSITFKFWSTFSSIGVAIFVALIFMISVKKKEKNLNNIFHFHRTCCLRE